jgi:hypothetical protein
MLFSSNTSGVTNQGTSSTGVTSGEPSITHPQNPIILHTKIYNHPSLLVGFGIPNAQTKSRFSLGFS